MTTENFDDALLSDVLDGIADEETVAAVTADPAARQRLETMRAVSEMIATPPPPATADRRAASIAAALAVAETPAGVSSLAPARRARFDRRRVPTGWVAAAAAAVVALLAVPVIGSLQTDDDATIATEAASDAADAGSDGSRSLGDRLDGSDGGGDDMASAAAVEEAADTAAADGDDAGAESAAGDDTGAAGDDTADADASDDAADGPASTIVERSIPEVTSVDELRSRIDDGTIGPAYAIGDPLVETNVAQECLATFPETDEPSFALARIVPTDGPTQVVLVAFDDSGEISIFDGEDCSPVG